MIKKTFLFPSDVIMVEHYHWDKKEDNKYEITNKSNEWLGHIEYWSPKKEFVFRAVEGIVYTVKSLNEIIRLVKHLNETEKP